MKLTKAEKTIAIIFVVALILGVGIFAFIYPQYQKIGKNQKNLESKKQEYATLMETLSREATINDEIKAAYDKAKDSSDCFYEDMTTEEADVIMHELMDAIKRDLDSLSIANFATTSLSVSFLDEVEVTYPLKEYSKSDIIMPGAAAKEDTSGAAAENDTGEPTGTGEETELTEEELRLLLSSSETVGSIALTFEVIADTDGLLEFLDYIAELPKASYISNVSLEYGKEDEETAETDPTLKKGEYKTSITVTLLCVEPMQEPVF